MPTNEPPPLRAITGAACLSVRNVPVMLRSIVARNASTSASTQRPDVQRAARARHHDVELPRGLARRLDRSARGRFVGDVGHDEAGVAAELADRFLEALLGAPADRDLGAVGREPPGGAEADAAAAARDQRRVALQSTHGLSRRRRRVRVGVNRTGIASRPLMKFAGRRGSDRRRRRARGRAGARAAARTSPAARGGPGWPRQKWAPNPNATCSFGARSMSNRYGSSNSVSSRLADS